MSAPNNPSAFPVNPANLGDAGAYPADPGRTLRDWFAGQALPAVIASCANDTEARGMGHTVYFAKTAYALADALLSERERSQ